ncbi:uncharacterized protein BO88DRAFT_205566 [Aspergillus vadensis CBS 113365]|uniref:Uncharacterized protein n=1 Tax=Aspergillus vadensis (strain CBS 113365 / IMI 142717 / IBT 24658) TaxID=1448311 RepID=A0A319BIE4_ASPVC|nr:hypothetical protein BO88DRAFT_205566 [Aspergillus vadensis CBS 113365]PYH72061.1 hypothetical protein BO88DRAFT_205566 [Aspergillus vadensis CBS 113365]
MPRRFEGDYRWLRQIDSSTLSHDLALTAYTLPVVLSSLSKLSSCSLMSMSSVWFNAGNISECLQLTSYFRT